MAEKDSRYEYTLSDEELGCTEMVYIACTMLESRGYPGFMEMFNVLNDPVLIMKLIRLFYGTTIKFPPLQEVVDCLRASEYAYTDMHKKINDKLFAKPLDIRTHMGISAKEEAKLLEIFDQWIIYMNKVGYPVDQMMHINRQNTRKRIKNLYKGKRWTAAKY